MSEGYDELFQEVLQCRLNTLHETNQEHCHHDEDNGLRPDDDPACPCVCACGCGRCVWARECELKRCDCAVDLKAVKAEAQSILAEAQMRRDLEAYYYSTRGI